MINDNHFLKNAGYSNYEDTLELPRHRWYYYKEGFSPLLVEKAIEQSGLRTQDIIIDPFNGSGTTTLTAAAQGFKSYGIEVNPFTAFLSQTKVKSVAIKDIATIKPKFLKAIEKGVKSELLGFSTFSKTKDLDKWLFNNQVLNSFEGGWSLLNSIKSHNLKRILKLSLIVSAMENCNATRDGKCLRYRESWKDAHFDKHSFLESIVESLDVIESDIQNHPLETETKIICGDARTVLQKDSNIEKFKLCITSPPYLNTFDYTDIYRPELFLGKFITSQEELYKLRFKTVRSHVQAAWEKPVMSDFGVLYDRSIKHLNDNKDALMDKKIPLMVQAYFEDMFKIFELLKQKALKDAQLWIVVSNSAYANMEIPVDLILGDIGAKAGWFLKEVAVLRYIKRRKTRHSKDINELRESVVLFS
jgi:DNA modification methylase